MAALPRAVDDRPPPTPLARLPGAPVERECDWYAEARGFMAEGGFSTKDVSVVLWESV